jgi:hypothetical protein
MRERTNFWYKNGMKSMVEFSFKFAMSRLPMLFLTRSLGTGVRIIYVCDRGGSYITFHSNIT